MTLVEVSPEDKPFWTGAGASKEAEFVDRVLPAIGFAGCLNPQKLSDPYAPDLVVEGRLADLKCQRTPFFKAHGLYGIDPQFAVTFNDKDYRRYREHYPSIDVFFWVVWQTTERTIGGEVYAVRPMAGVWRASFPALRRRIEQRRVGAHEYLRRLFDDQGNAKHSYVFDVRQFEFLGGSTTAHDAMTWSEVPTVS